MSCSLHDAAAFEELGIPTVVLVTDAFTPSVEEQIKAFNWPGFRAAFVKHPLAALPPDEVHAKADAVVEAVERILLGT